MTDPIADMLTRIRNAVMVRRAEVVLPYSRMKHTLAELLVQEGFIDTVEKFKQEGNPHESLRLKLRYKDGRSVIRGLKRVSTPGRRVYRGYQAVPGTLPSLGIYVLSTSSGLMTNIEAKKKKIGGEILCEIY